MRDWLKGVGVTVPVSLPKGHTSSKCLFVCLFVCLWRGGSCTASDLRPLLLPRTPLPCCAHRFVSILSSSSCTVVVGAVAGVVTVEMCQGVRIIAAASHVRVRYAVVLEPVLCAWGPVLGGGVWVDNLQY